MLDAGKARQVYAGMHASARRVGDRRDAIVHQRVAIECYPMAQMGQSVAEIKGAETRSGIFRRVFYGKRHIIKAEKALQKCVQRDRFVSLSAPDNHAGKAKLNIRSRLEVDLLYIEPMDRWDRYALSGCPRRSHSGTDR